MRVIAGIYRGRLLSAPSWTGLRPTSDKLRETIFNILALRLPGARVLDLYAGTGALGIEALSRGAAVVTFVERDRRAQKLIEENLERCGITDGYVIIRASVTDALAQLHDRSAVANAGPFDIAFLDPPYDRGPGTGEITATLASAANLMGQGAVVVLEHSRRRPSTPTAGRLVRTREVTAGDSALAFYACQP
jgi:16S rRNA (guanine(966)-N(2))-methyltransferase RsmD